MALVTFFPKDPFSMLEAQPDFDVHLHRSTFRHLQGNPILLATRPHFTDCWGQKYRLRRGTVYQKPLESGTESFKSQAEEKNSGQTPAAPYEEEESIKDPEIAVDNQQKPRVTDGKPAMVLANPHREPQPHHRKPSSLEANTWDDGKGKPSEQAYEGCDGKNGVCGLVSIPPLPGRCLGLWAGPQ